MCSTKIVKLNSVTGTFFYWAVMVIVLSCQLTLRLNW